MKAISSDGQTKVKSGRLTINGSHFVDKTPISQTIFATDKIFGYETSNVKNLLFQKSKSQINLDDIQNLLLSDLEMLNTEENNIVFKKGTPRKLTNLNGSVLSLLTGGGGNNNYWHWLFDVLRRIG